MAYRHHMANALSCGLISLTRIPQLNLRAFEQGANLE
jgi:hypothetical protein